MRLFSAVRIPEEVTEHLVHTLRPFRERAGNMLRWVDPDNWHITLDFFGEQPASFIDSFSTVGEPCELQLSGAGEFQHRTLWIGVGGATRELRSMMNEQRRPHMTIARRSRRGFEWEQDVLIDDFVHALSIYRSPRFPVTEIELISSELGRGRGGGPLYETVSKISL